MKRITTGLVAALAACALALCIGCSSTQAGSTSEQAASSGQAPAAASEGASPAASASSDASAGTQAASTLDPANLEDGDYQIEVSLEGGSGKAYIESPAKLSVADGAMMLVVVWSSPNYDQMIVDGQDYYPVPRAGNSTFQIPLASLQESLPIQAETTAMSEPHMIDYVIHFDLATLQ